MTRTARPIVVLGASLAAAVLLAASVTRAQSLPLLLFEQYLDALRLQARIPGLSAAIVGERGIVWERGLGLQDVEASIRAAPDTLYPVEGLTQTFTSVLLLQCVEGGRLTLDDAVALPPATPEELPSTATIRQLMSHTSRASLAEPFRYDPAAYALLTRVAERCSGRTFRKGLALFVLDRLAMTDSVPGLDLVDPGAEDRYRFDQAALDRYHDALTRLAVGYRLDRGRPVRAAPLAERGVNAATGLVSTVRDLARFDVALVQTTLEDPFLLQRETLAMAWTNVAAADGTPLPTALGWFAQTDRGDRVVWHFGQVPGAYSSMFLKLPDRKLTLILLANSDGLSAPFPLAAGNVTESLFARLFLRLFGSQRGAEP